MKWLLFVMAAIPSTLPAQGSQCVVPGAIDRPRADTPDSRTPRRVLATASYTLAVSWAPLYCRENGERPGSAFQCASGNRFGFVLHGLWPDGAGKDWPQYCRPVELLSEATLRANLCATPSVQLLQHEWAKHGSCMNGSADDYFWRATGLYRRLNFPDMTALSRQRTVTAGSLAAAIARTNPGTAPDMMRLTAAKGGWLDEVWLCLDLNFATTRCPVHQGGVAPTTRLKIWRGERIR